MKHKWLILSVLGIAIWMGAFIYQRQDKVNYVVWVNGEGISKLDYAQELAHTKQFYIWAKQDVKQLPSLDKDVLQRMIETKIVDQYAKKNKISVSQKEIEENYQASLGKRSEIDFLKLISEMYGQNKQDYQQKLADDLLREKVQAKLGEPLANWLARMEKTAAINYNTIKNGN